MATKTAIATVGALILIPVLIAALAQGALSALFATPSASQPSQTALADIPAAYLALYRAAATVCPGLDWSILAAIGKIESDHGRSTLPGVHSGENPAGAGGPMQFLQPTFDAVISRHRLPPGGASPPSRYDPHDAIYAAADKLCDDGADYADLHAAIFAYNHAQCTSARSSPKQPGTPAPRPPQPRSPRPASPPIRRSPRGVKNLIG